MYDPLLRARQKALSDIEEDLSVEEFEVAERAIDLYIDKVEYELEHARDVKIESTGHMVITSNNEAGKLEYDSSN